MEPANNPPNRCEPVDETAYLLQSPANAERLFQAKKTLESGQTTSPIGGVAMLDLETVESAVAQLPPADLAEFRRWFAEFDSDAWDAQIEADAAAGKLDALAAEALAEYNAGKAREI
jgi:hypothetical protein